MALIYSNGMLEPEEVADDVVEVAKQLNKAANETKLFAVLDDIAGDPVVFNVPEIIKIKGDES